MLPACPGEETVSAYVEGVLAAVERTALEDHLEGCASCRRLVAALAGTAASPGGDGVDPLTGVTIGRYTLGELLGSGGMGLVYRAHDPVLDREVAVKLIHAVEIHPARRDRLLREARAMARLSHPNVVTVFDAGESGDELFIAMELVVGTTLRERCLAPLAWRQVVGLCLAAARGVAAAHRAGVVHRDVKPDNILVGDGDVVRVTDFGLARASPGPPGLASPTGDAGTGLAGTPAYLAPEVRAGAEPTAASDQYAFCLTLQECLGGRAPRRVAPILRRGLADDPARRFATMDALVAALEAAVSRRRLAAGALGSAVLVAGAAWFIAGGGDRPDRCDGPRARMASLWNAEQKRELRAAISRLGLRRGEQMARRLEARLDDHARRWVEMRTSICREGGDDAIAARRTACLEEGLGDLGGFLEFVRGEDQAAVRQVEWVSYGLTPPERCSATAPVSLLPSPDPAVRADVARAGRELRAAVALADDGKLAEALAAVRVIEETARRLGYGPLEATAMSDEAMLLARSGDIAGARTRFEGAVELAEASGDDAKRGQLLANLVILSAATRDPDAALAYAARARPVVERLGLPTLEGELWRAEGQARLVKGEVATARADLERALAVWDRALVGDHDAIVATLNALAHATFVAGDWPAADAHHRRSYEMTVRLYGEEHPTAATTLRDWAVGQLNHADTMEAGPARDAAARRALAHLDEATARLARVAGPDHPDTAQSRTAICNGLHTLRDLDRAAPACEEALAVSRRAHGAGSAQLAWPLTVLGFVRHARGELAPAAAALEEALAVHTRTPGDPARKAEVQFELAKVLGEQGKKRRAVSLARAARVVMAADPRMSATLPELDAWLARQARGGR